MARPPLGRGRVGAGVKFNDSEFVDAVDQRLAEFCAMDPGPRVLFLGNGVNQIYELEGEQAFREFLDGMNRVAGEVKSSPGVPENL
ncbi:MAG: hypothetical protein Kow0069_02320 [Promethearchaeota archaeon]